MNAQREVIYKRRYNALFGERLRIDIANMIFDTAESITESNALANDYDELEFDSIRFFSVEPPFTKEEFEKMQPQKIAGELYKTAYKNYEEKMIRNAEVAFPVIKQVYEQQGNRFERIAVPFSDGTKTLQVATNLKNAYESEGKELVTDFEKNITLAIIDEAWKNHLRKMDELKQSVQLAVHEQKDPLLIYKFEAFELFKVMLDAVNKEVISFLFKGEIPQRDSSAIQEARSQRPREQTQTRKEEVRNLDEQAAQNRAAGQQAGGGRPQITETIVREQPKIGRNDKVVIKNVTNGEEKTVKYKQALPLLQKGEWVLIKSD
jgi:preprotein translocase subunit SecA